MQMKDKMVFDVNMLASNKIMATTARKTTTFFFSLSILLPMKSRFLVVCLFVLILTQAGDMQNHTLIVVTNLKR